MYFLKDVIDMLLTITCDFKAAFALGARVLYSLGTNVNTPFFQGRVLVLGHKKWALTGSLCAHNFCKFRAVQCFVLAAKLRFQNGV